jgi:hypothetical protein
MTTQRMSVTDYLLFELNRLARDRGDDVQLIWEYPEHPDRPRPKLATKDGEIVPLRPGPQPAEKGQTR